MSDFVLPPVASRRLRIVILFAVMAVLAALLTTATGAGRAFADGGTATVSGTVTDASTSAPISGISVYISSADGSYFDIAVTADDGTYALSAIPAGSYTLQFQPDEGQNYVQQCWNDDSCVDNNQTYFTVADGAVLTGYDAALVPGATIEGTVTDSSGNPVENVNVNASSSDGGSGFSTTDGNGDYAISGLAAGSYELDYQPTEGNYLESWWDDQPTEATANLVTVDSGAVANGIDQQLQPGATISGTVSTSDGPLADAVVQAFDPTNPLENEQPGVTDANGDYTITGLPDGSFDVQFSAPDSNTLATQWWQNASTEAAATPVPTSIADPATGIDATLVPGGSISGRIFAPGTPKVGLANASVSIFPTNGGGPILGVGTNRNGHYTITNVPAGTYSISIVTGGNSGVVAEEWWGGTFIETGAQSLTVSSGEAITGINQQLIVGSPISGSITAGGEPAANDEVDIWSSDEIVGQNDQPPFETFTDANGDYTLPNMGPGKYTVDILSLDPHYASQWWNDKPNQARATQVKVTKDVAVTGIDATLAPVVITPTSPTISGRPRVGSTLTAHTHHWTPRGLIFTYQWLADGQPIEGATSSTYVPTAQDLGVAISVAVTGTTTAYESQGLSETAVSAATAPIRRALE
jgi:hypothetical protein